jgi:Hg(II)-responsive transcriptional regulator
VRTNEVAKEAGVNVQTLKYYERRGLLQEPKRRASGYREYGTDAVARVRFIKRAQELGFTLAEIAELLTLREHAERTRPEARALAATKITTIDRKVGQLLAMREALSRLVEACQCDGGALECPICEALEEGTAARTAEGENE